LERVTVSPDFETQVRAAKFYKNGVSSSILGESTFSQEAGYYKELERTRVYDKYTIGGGGAVTGPVDYTIITTYYTEGSKISATEPTVITEDEKTPLLENEYLIFPPKSDSSVANGGEISDGALLECRNNVESLDWTPIASWSGDQTVVLEGAGSTGGEDKTNQFVYHGKRRFKKVGNPGVTIETPQNMPSTYYHHSFIQYSDLSEVDTSGNINFDKNRGVYIDENFLEISSDVENILGLELVKDELSLNPGEYLYKDVTKYAKEFYQTLEMTSNESEVV
jgi:hypothetical protein